MKRLLLLPLLILSMVGLGFYFIGTYGVEASQAVAIVHPECVVDNGLFSRTYYMEYDVMPTEYTEAGIVYRVVVDNGFVRQADKLCWTELELEIGKAKPISHKISDDEIVALGLHPQYTTKITEIRSERDGTYLTLPFLYIGVMALMVMSGVDIVKRQRKHTRPFRRPITAKKMSDEAQVRVCLQCGLLQAVNGVMRCSRETCKY